jgi:uncharacterized protein YkwD
MTHEKTTKPLCTNARAWWMLRVGAVSVVLVLASLLLSIHPLAAQTPASDQYEPNEPTTSAPASPAQPEAETDTTVPPSDTHNESGGGEAFDPAQEAPRTGTPGNSEGGEDASASPEPPSDSNSGQVPSANTPSSGDPDAGSDSGPIVPSILPDWFSQGESGTGNTTAPRVPKAAVEGLRSGLNELHGALNSLLDTMRTVLPFTAEQPANPGAETNTTARGEVTEVHSDNPEPASDPNGDQVSSDTTKVTDCNGQEAMLDDRAAELLRLHNEFRAAHGLEPFCVQKNLMTAAQGHAEDMLRRGYYEHNTPEGVEHDKRISRAGYACNPQGCYTAENIHNLPADETMEKVFEDWINSPGHRDNILNPNVREIGIGLKSGQSPERSGTMTRYTVNFASGQ